ncbi:MAG: helix-turn-helix domain-containing protein, partial [Ferruginibacter sp.]
LLSLVLIVFNFLCIKIIILTTGLWQTQLLRYIPLSFELAIQPLIWLYISSLTIPDFRLSKKYLIHFLPFSISFAYSLLIYIAVLFQKDLVVKDVIANSFYFNNVKEAEDFLSIISSLLYWLLSLRLVLQYREWVYSNISDTDYPTYAWLKNISILMGVLIAGLTVDIILDYFFHFGYHHFFHWQIFFVYLSILIYYMGFRGYQLADKKIIISNNAVQPNILIPRNQFKEELIDNPVLSEKFEEPSIFKDKETKLSIEKEKQVEEAITTAFEIKKLYLNPELNLQKFAKEINISSSVVSTVINTRFRKSFRNLVNEFRVKEVKQRLADPKSNRFSILGIAYQCGFNSEASFYRIFKATAGISPKEYVKQQQTKR